MNKKQNNGTRELSDKITIATTTLYQPDAGSDIRRAEITKDTIRTAVDLGYLFFIVDGGSSDELLGDFENLGATVIQKESMGMGESRRYAIKSAHDSGKEIIAWLEPEKKGYISEIAKTAAPIIEGSADLVVPSRESLDSYPSMQKYAELFGNLFWKELTGCDLDVWFGPRTWKREISDYFLDYGGEYGDKWDSIFVPVMDAIIDGRKVISVEVCYTHPKEQTMHEEGNLMFCARRINQLNNLITALKARWKEAS